MLLLFAVAVNFFLIGAGAVTCLADKSSDKSSDKDDREDSDNEDRLDIPCA